MSENTSNSGDLKGKDIFEALRPLFEQNDKAIKELGSAFKPAQIQIENLGKMINETIVLPSATVYTFKPAPKEKKKTKSEKQQYDTVTKEYLGKNIYLIANSSFKYKNRNLSAISLDNQAGKWLLMLLRAPENIVTDQQTIKEFNLSDGTRSVSYIKRSVNKLLAKNNLKAIIERRKKSKSYVLIDIVPVPK